MNLSLQLSFQILLLDLPKSTGELQFQHRRYFRNVIGVLDGSRNHGVSSLVKGKSFADRTEECLLGTKHGSVVVVVVVVRIIGSWCLQHVLGFQSGQSQLVHVLGQLVVATGGPFQRRGVGNGDGNRT